MRFLMIVAVALGLGVTTRVEASPDEGPFERRERRAEQYRELPRRMLQQLIDGARGTALALREEEADADFDDNDARAVWWYRKDRRLPVEVTLSLVTEPAVGLAELQAEALAAPTYTSQERERDRRLRGRGLPTVWSEMRGSLNEVVEEPPDGRPRFPPTGHVFRMSRAEAPHRLYQDLRRGRETHLCRQAERGWLLLTGAHRERHGAGYRTLRTAEGEVYEVHPGTGVEGAIRLRGVVVPPHTREVAVHLTISASYGQVDDLEHAPHFGKGTPPPESLFPAAQLLRIQGDQVPLEREFLALFEAIAGRLRAETTAEFDGLGSLPGAWFHARHLTLVGTPHAGVGLRAQALVALYERIAVGLRTLELGPAHADVVAYADAVAALGAAIEEASQSSGDAAAGGFECRAYLRGLPSDEAHADLELAEELYRHWSEMGTIARGNVRDIGAMLVREADTFSANVLKSVVRNYINWAGAVPAAPERIATLLGEKAALAPWDLPRAASSWIREAERDASILADQSRSIAELKRLLAFYGERDKASVRECAQLMAAIRAREPARALDRRWREVVEGLPWATWQARALRP